MIPNVVRGGGFYGCLNYLFGESKNAVIVATNMIGRNPAELAQEFEWVRQLNMRSPIPVWHVSLAGRADEQIPNDLWCKIVETFIRKVGEQAGKGELAISPDRNQYVAVRHHDKAHPHIHIVLNRITPAGECCYCKWDYNRAQQACREIEKEFDLVLVLGKQQEAEVDEPGSEPEIEQPSQENNLELQARLNRQAIAQLEKAYEQTGVISPKLQRYYDQRQQRLEEIADDQRLSKSDAPDRTGTSTADSAEGGRADLAEATATTGRAVADFIESLAAVDQSPPTGQPNQPTTQPNRLDSALDELDFGFAAPTRTAQSNRSADRRVEPPREPDGDSDSKPHSRFAGLTQRLGDRLAGLSRSITDFFEQQFFEQCRRLIEGAVEFFNRSIEFFQFPTENARSLTTAVNRRNAEFGEEDRQPVAPQQPTQQVSKVSEVETQVGYIAVDILLELLNGINDDEFEGKKYRTRWDKQTDTLTLLAKDGRGEILRYEEGNITLFALSKDDGRALRDLKRVLDNDRQQQQPPKSQIEMGD